MQKIAAIRLRGKFNIRGEIEDTLTLLGLKRKNTCVILELNKYNLGMLKKAKDYITYGEIKEDILKKLLEIKKPEKQTDKKIILRLPNPKKGFKSIKKGFGQGGDLGYRGEEINELLERIINNLK